MRGFIKTLIGTGKNIILIAHVVEDKDDETGRIMKRPLIPTGLKDELINMVDVVAYFQAMKTDVAKDEAGEEHDVTVKRFLSLKPGGSYVAKDRTEKLGDYIKPEWDYIRGLLEDAIDETEVDEPTEPVDGPEDTPENVEQEVADAYDATDEAPTQQELGDAGPVDEPVDEPAKPQDNFDNSTVAELTSVAKALGKEIPSGAKKADIIAILRS
jgi:hypothetical protein